MCSGMVVGETSLEVVGMCSGMVVGETSLVEEVMSSGMEVGKTFLEEVGMCSDKVEGETFLVEEVMSSDMVEVVIELEVVEIYNNKAHMPPHSWLLGILLWHVSLGTNAPSSPCFPSLELLLFVFSCLAWMLALYIVIYLIIAEKDVFFNDVYSLD